ncbi:MAG: hypothetical protein OEV49_12620 [candidate division Zixibacteria bacterium]|nr:hypothetical protein [candidate division Zixibacteria bacterium]MDH3936979.1 hypothetical protein [candidate division Zixibacteria bacterium]MDH4032800.1 hypothetical protein [candidate division Zixibacteria bacterium]
MYVRRIGFIGPAQALLSVALVLSAIVASITTGPVAAGELSGRLSLESRAFPQTGLADSQRRFYPSLALEPEYYHTWGDGRQTLVVSGFYRYDQHDERRTHGVIGELFWLYAADRWEVKAGLITVFWGVTESMHLVDIINQTDLIENPDSEDKLGQPAINFTLLRRWGTLDLFLMPGFRERSFPGVDGRLRSATTIEFDDARYESPAGQNHFDWAARWFHSVGDYEFALAHFRGTGREPSFVVDNNSGSTPSVHPYYRQIDQTSLEFQATNGNWLWKLEAISRAASGERFASLVGGFEYTLSGVMGSAADVGLLAEYLYDDRDESATTPFADDVFVGARLGFNDVSGSELLVGAIVDRESGASVMSVEAARRLNDSWKFNIEGRAMVNTGDDNRLSDWRRDSYLLAELVYHY